MNTLPTPLAIVSPATDGWSYDHATGIYSIRLANGGNATVQPHFPAGLLWKADRGRSIWTGLEGSCADAKSAALRALRHQKYNPDCGH